MALPVDSFGLLLDEISSTYRNLTHFDFKSLTWKDWLAILGALYATSKAITMASHTYTLLKQFGLSRCREVDLVRKYGPWAVVTGCTSGIGKALTLELAARGCNVVLVSRSFTKLHDLCTNIEKEFGVQTKAIAVDFNDDPHIYESIWDGIKDKEIGILVNNVGVMYDYPQPFLDVPEEKLWQLVRVNVAAATLMTKKILPQMVERNQGAIITVSSAASYMPTPQMTVYSATKSYLDFFIRGLQYEYIHSNITFQCLTPFYVATHMTKYSSTLSNPCLWIPSAAVYARHALGTLGRVDKTTGYWPHTVQEYLTYLVPYSWRVWFAMHLNNGFRRQALTRIRHRSGEEESRSRSSSMGSMARRSSTSALTSPRRTSLTASTSGMSLANSPSEMAARLTQRDSPMRISVSDTAIAHT